MRCLTGLVFAIWFSHAALAHPLDLAGDFVQGGLVRGQVLPESRVVFEGRRLKVDGAGRFVFGFGRDAPAVAKLTVTYPDGYTERRVLEVAKRDFEVQRIDGLPARQVSPSARDLERIQADQRLIDAARSRESALGGFFEAPLWPVAGPLTGVFGSQRILNGQPRSPHRGVDIAAPTGTPVRAPTSGIVSLAQSGMYFTGGTVVIDHGHGLHSIYAHLSEVLVEEGERIGRGRMIGKVGATGRATGPHLHWGVFWFDEALDPALLAGPDVRPD